jgi:hypothetical protein
VRSVVRIDGEVYVDPEGTRCVRVRERATVPMCDHLKNAVLVEDEATPGDAK